MNHHERASHGRAALLIEVWLTTIADPDFRESLHRLLDLIAVEIRQAEERGRALAQK